jgi:hypothetical protein
VVIALAILLLAGLPLARAALPTGLEPEVFAKDAYYFDKYFQKLRTFEIKGDELIVRWRDWDVRGPIDQVVAEMSLAVIHDVQKYYGHAHYRIPDGAELLDVISTLQERPEVHSAYPVLVDDDGHTKYVVGHELTVRFADGLDDARCREIIRAMGSEVAQDHFTPGYYTITVPPGRSLFQAIREFNELPEVRFAEFSAIGYDDLLFFPNDPIFPNQQNLRNTGQISSCSSCTPYEDHDIEAVTGWDVSRGSPDVIIAIIDTGVDLDHPDLVDNILDRGNEDWDFADPNDDVPEDEEGHGTSCAGVAAAVTDNGIGIAGVANLCRIMPIRVDLTSGMNQNRADAINYVATRLPLYDGIVMSNSWRMSSGQFSAVYDAIENAHNTGCVVVFAAGNGGGQPVEAPADSEFCIAVSALSPCDELKTYSSCDGEGWRSSYGTAVDLCAPGVLINTTSMGGGYTSTFNGTSSACPHVAGAAALVLSEDPTMTPAEVQAHLQETADDLGTPGPDIQFGYGRINLYNALSNLMSVRFDKDEYMCVDTVVLTVHDRSQPSSVEVEVSSGEEPVPEIVALTEVEPGVYEGTLQVSDEVGPDPGDGVIAVTEGDTLMAYYAAQERNDYAGVDCTSPAISSVEVVAGSVTTLITWITDEPATTVVYYGLGLPSEMAEVEGLVTEHSIELTELEMCAGYSFYVVSADAAGNETVDDNGGENYRFLTGERVIALEETMDEDPGWTISGGAWAWGVPQGQCQDPTSGFTGTDVYGYNLGGCYTNYMPAYSLTSTAIDCSELTNTTLHFYRWLGVESATYDHASLQVSTDGTTFQTIWDHSGSTLIDSSWVELTYDVSQWVDGEPTVYLRWVMGPTDVSVVYSGWNIDDVSLYADRECPATPTPLPPTATPSPSPSPSATPSPSPTSSPTPLPTDTPTPTPLPTDTPSPTPVPSATPIPPSATPEPTSTPAPTATPNPDGMYLTLNDNLYTQGDLFLLWMHTENSGDPIEVEMYIILDVWGSYWFWPSWVAAPQVDYVLSNVPHGTSEETSILNFTWPSGAGKGEGIVFWGGCLRAGTLDLWGQIARVEFSFE